MKKSQEQLTRITGKTHLNSNKGGTLHDGIYLFPTD